MLPLSVFLTGIKLIGAAQAALPEVKDIIHAAIQTLHPTDQQSAIAAYQHLIADNDEGYAELDRLLAAAEIREEPQQG
jgi:hypothetical protein